MIPEPPPLLPLHSALATAPEATPAATCTDAAPCLSMMLASPAEDPADDGDDDGNDDGGGGGGGGGGAAEAVALAASAPAAYVAASSLTARTASAVALPLRPMQGQPGVIAKASVDAVFQSAFQDRVPLQKNSPSSSRSSFSRFVASRKEHACIDAVFQSAFQDRVPLQKNSPDADMLCCKVPLRTEFHCERTRHRAEAPRSHDVLHREKSMRRPYESPHQPCSPPRQKKPQGKRSSVTPCPVHDAWHYSSSSIAPLRSQY